MNTGSGNSHEPFTNDMISSSLMALSILLSIVCTSISIVWRGLHRTEGIALPEHDSRQPFIASPWAVTPKATLRRIQVWSWIRVVLALALIVFSVLDFYTRGSNESTHQDHSRISNPLLWLPAFWLYFTLLAVGVAISKSMRLRDTFFANVVIIGFVPVALLIYSDLLPNIYVDSRYQPTSIHAAYIALTSAVCLILPMLTPRFFRPDPTSAPFINALDVKPVPQQICTPLSFLSHSYMDKLVWWANWGNGHQRAKAKGEGVRMELDDEMLPPLMDTEITRKQQYRLEKAYYGPTSSTAARTPKRSFFLAILLAYRTRFLLLASMLILDCIADYGSPVVLNRILRTLEPATEQNVDGRTVALWVWMALLLFWPTVRAATEEYYVYLSVRLRVVLRNAMLMVIYDKVMRIRFEDDDGGSKPQDKAESSTKGQAPNAPGRSLSGKINNMISADTEAGSDLRNMGMVVIEMPFRLAVGLYLLYNILGWSVFAGTGFLIVMMALMAWVSKMQAQKLKERKLCTDARVGIVTEMVNSARVIKFFSWEQQWSKRIGDARNTEIDARVQTAIRQIMSYILESIIPILTMLIMFGTFTFVQGGRLTASVAFTALALFDRISSTLNRFTFDLNILLDATTSIKRMDNFFRDTEELDSIDSLCDNAYSTTSQRIGFHHASFTWSAPTSTFTGPTDGQDRLSPPESSSAQASGSVTPTEDRQFSLLDLDVEFIPSGLNLVVGHTGSGKSSLLLALLGEMRPMSNTLSATRKAIINLPRAHGIAYVSQSAWLLNDTIKNNILFGSPYDQGRYEKVLYQCALEPDILLFEAGDQTEVGERGLTLSGGQKQRLALARAVYSSAQIVLMDDVLSALDAQTAQHCFEKCLLGDLMESRTRILVTHHVALTAHSADLIVVMKNGRILETGQSEVLKCEADFGDILQQEAASERGIDSEKVVEQKTKQDDKGPKTAAGKVIEEEKQATGSSAKWAMFKVYYDSCGGSAFAALLMTTMLLAVGTGVWQSWWLSIWTRSNEDTSHDGDTGYFLSGYVLIGLLSASLAIIQMIEICYASFTAARKIHARFVARILNAPLLWFDKTPVGRIINRFSNDMNTVDGSLANMTQWVLSVAFSLLTVVFAIGVVLPIFLIPGVLVTIVALILGSLFSTTQLPLRRLMAKARSPLFSGFGDAIAGAVTIRAFNAGRRFEDIIAQRSDDQARVVEVLWNTNRWVGFRINIAGAFMTFIAAIIAVTAKDVDASAIGFSVNMALRFSGYAFGFTRGFNNWQGILTNWERIVEYLEIEQEPVETDAGKPPASWPTDGDIVVKDLSVRYSNDGPQVLKNVNFEVKAGERIGIVGRTGSGKSTLGMAMLRLLVQDGGHIYVNGRDISQTNLHALRSSITIIPQDPVLFSGTMRSNLDPFDEHDDATLNACLHSVGLLNTVAESDDGDGMRVSLDSRVTNGGSNFSQGQRQLIAMARAQVRRSKIIILDEATASVDNKTDERISSAIRTEFKNSTLLTVAHRLVTIIDYDRILVLDKGQVVEFDEPLKLLENKTGIFASLIEQSGQKDLLVEMAKAKAR